MSDRSAKRNALPASSGALARGTLGRRLVVRVAALVAVVALSLSTVVAFAVYNIQIGQLDTRLDDAASRGSRGPGGNSGNRCLSPVGGGQGQEIGTVIVCQSQSMTRGYVLIEGSGNSGVGFAALSDEALAQLANVTIDSGSKAVIALEDYGVYRVTIRVDPDGDYRTIVGVPLDPLRNAMANLLIIEALLTGATILVAIVVVQRVVLTSLAPLNRLAATATSVSNLPLESGEVTGIGRVNATDTDPVNEVGRVGLAFNHMLDNVEGALEARHASEVKLRQFVADASHELRNPLAAIRGYAELTRRERASMTPGMSHALVRIEAESDRMSSLVEDLLLLARLDSDPRIEAAPTDLTEIILNATSDARVAGPDHHWSLSLPDEPVTVLGDRYRLHQVLANLLANARTHTPPGSHVHTAVRVEGDRAVISVTDDGPGIDPTLQRTVFERFTRGDSSRVRQAGGSSTGLGLAIVAAVISAHHGTASVESEPGKGTTFSITLPLAPSDRTAD